MNTKTINILIFSIIAGLLICVGILVRQHMQLKSLQEQLNEQATHVYQVEKALKISQANRASIFQIRSFASGIYKLTTEVAVDPFENERDVYTVYHFVFDVEVGAVKRKLQFGYARSGLFTHVFYFDHDSDGKIDTKMMKEYAKSIPVIGEAASWLVDPELSQSVYNSFRLNSERAEKLSMDKIAATADDKIGILWNWINDSSKDFAAWVENAVEFD